MVTDWAVDRLAVCYVMIAAMMAQINYYAPRMGLPIPTPIRAEEIRRLDTSMFIHPRLAMVGGRLQVTNYSFSFGLQELFIANLDEHGYVSLGVPMTKHESSNSGMERASRLKYVVSTNDVYRMATNWLTALDFDIQEMEKKQALKPEPHLFKSVRGWVPSPLLSAHWTTRSNSSTDVYVEISAVTGELVKLHTGNGSFSKRNRPIIQNLQELGAISNEEFLEYSVQQRMDLVSKFAGVTNRQDIFTNIPSAMCRRIFGAAADRSKSSP